MNKKPTVIVSAAPAPGGGGGGLVSFTACKLEYPLRVLGTLIFKLSAALEKHDLKRNVASLYNGGGEATAIEGIT